MLGPRCLVGTLANKVTAHGGAEGILKAKALNSLSEKNLQKDNYLRGKVDLFMLNYKIDCPRLGMVAKMGALATVEGMPSLAAQRG